MERLLNISFSHNGATPVTLASNTYDAFGRLAACSVNNGGISTAYAYNVRGWVQSVTNAHFYEWIHYQDAPSGGTPFWGGGFSGITWLQCESLKAATSVENQYKFSYDGLNRLTKADFSSSGEQWNGDLISQGDRDFSCSYAYDLNGNMKSLRRYGVSLYNTSLPTHIRNYGIIDDLTMAYDGNWLKKVTDQCEELSYAGAMDFKDGADKDEEYTYDANGNMTCDRNKGIVGITYNTLNLPQRILFKDSHENRYTYAADGRKLRTEYRLNNFAIIEADEAAEEAEPATFFLPSVGGVIDEPIEFEPAYTTLMTRDYCGNYIYCNGTLERILTDNGYIQGGEYYFYIKDYQGNIRVVLNQNNQPVELNSYYPYGALMAATATEGIQPYKYSAKELDRENGLDWYDFHARQMDPMVPRFTSPDPKCEKYYAISPYAYCAANPVKFVDPTGKWIVGTDGKDVSFDKKKGWSSNATVDIVKIAGSMMRTKQGRKTLNKMINSRHPITLHLDRLSSCNTQGDVVAGETFTDYIIDKNGNAKEFEKVVIVIYEKVIKDNMLNDAMYKDSGLSTSDIIGTVATHEGTHGTDKQANSSFVSKRKAERKALEIEQKAVDELKRKK